LHPPPPFSLSPTTPISYPPTPADAAGAREGGHVAGGDLDAEVRRFVGGHPMLTPSPRAYSRVRRLVEAVGWEGARHAIDDAVAKGATDPPSYALAVVGGEQARERVAADNRNGRGHSNGAKPRKKQTPEEWARQPYTPMGPAER
jgi:hypothetical protein